MTMKPTIPRRSRLEENTAAELAIRAAVEAVEAVGCHTLLTEAVELLVNARHKVADYVDRIQPSSTPTPCPSDCGAYCCPPIPADVRFIITGLEEEPTKSEPVPTYRPPMAGFADLVDFLTMADFGDRRPAEFAVTKTKRNGEREETIDVRVSYAD